MSRLRVSRRSEGTEIEFQNQGLEAKAISPYYHRESGGGGKG